MTISESFSANLMTQKLVRKACQSIKAWSCSAPDLDIECLSGEVCKPVEKVSNLFNTFRWSPMWHLQCQWWSAKAMANSISIFRLVSINGHKYITRQHMKMIIWAQIYCKTTYEDHLSAIPSLRPAWMMWLGTWRTRWRRSGTTWTTRPWRISTGRWLLSTCLLWVLCHRCKKISI